MRNPLDLNSFPDDFSRDIHGKQTLDDDSSSSSSAASGGGIYRKKIISGAKDTIERGKVYECRFCSLKFCKSQALGGHMNRHRQERETEALNQARQLVFSNDNLLTPLPNHIGGQVIVHGGFHHQAAAGGNMGGTNTIYPSRHFSSTTTTTTISPPAPPQPPPPPASRLKNPYSSQHPINNYFAGHVCSGYPAPLISFQNMNAGARTPPPESTNSYTCIGASVGRNFTFAGANSGGKEMSQSSVAWYYQDGF